MEKYILQKKYISIYSTKNLSMHKVFYTKKARNNLEEIKNFIARDNWYYAEKVAERISAFIDSYLSIFIEWGKQIYGEEQIRIIIEPTFRYRIVYKIIDIDVYVVSISKYKQIETK